MTIYYQQMTSPFGMVHLYATKYHLRAVLFKPWQALDKKDRVATSNSILDDTKTQLSEYFAGQRKSFNLPLDSHGTDFQKTVWQTLMEIPFGQTWNYGQLAEAIGNKNASRAVGAANGKNPVSIIVPCHRVIGSNGSLTGYAGGLKAKEWLLKHEGVI
ncbi:methylated-DNA--[protein]-cysteine S-methyltransferase [Kangiella sediminilitoris]|uniref:Methylated-DNA--protein-cysteine methyltransferase n=1 Tax=Kangiella sediminilitoris TaxID=1144748 RepID=A0A1B3BC25_9GAMM|nr:methylated-DNA--[protein]-cysteine S-methyltransferase [Kangiella sediminilitoris]AOE50343.1 Methylated-DNA/protein-cysteinemethyltransferase [Kangiella sediminilitoris]